MTGTKAKRRERPSTKTVPILLSFDEISTLVRLSRYYGRTLGFVRRLIQVVGGGEMRAKARFVQEESYWLRRFAEANRDRMSSRSTTESTVEFTPRSLVAFYGRILATLNVPRTRRRLSPGQIQDRERLAEKLGFALTMLYAKNRLLIEEELDSRRSRERVWIEEALKFEHSETAH